ncbi:hypothetical protein N657DRAFT_600581 [Parathielavia appendiculata]|uniref:Mitochondrial outer membrane protein OM14 C-terminal domain-containing protein n=1 Tax=Parathielavia appendiculata TaxID=2587402 RepID=A0AAN6Z2F3_9PEZI|nr:hypothetical protein N657DRAFT_600581 [Parathielavia appendiculata]
MSYAEVASKGPKQTPEEAAAPQPPQVAPTTATASSTGSLVDVDAPSVRTVPSDFASQEIQTDTQAARIEREEELVEIAEEKAEAERAESDLARKRAAAKKPAAAAKKKVVAGVEQAEGWFARQFGTISEGGAAGGVALVNMLAVVGLSGWLGYRAWGLYDRGRLGWREVGLGLGVLGAVGAVEGVLVNYFSRAKASEQ